MSEIVSDAAIAISLLSFCLSGYAVFRDRGAVSASAKYLSSFQNLSDGIYVHVVNSGRRPVTIRRLVLEVENGSSFEHKLVKDRQPVRLLESVDYEFQVNPQNSEILRWAESKVLRSVVEDSRGKKYDVKGLVEIINEHATNIKQAI